MDDHRNAPCFTAGYPRRTSPARASLAEAAQSYFSQSEQIPSIVRLSALKGADGRWIAGGVLFQHLPEGEEGRERLHTRLDHPEWQHVAVMAGSTKAEELTDPALSLQDLDDVDATVRAIVAAAGDTVPGAVHAGLWIASRPGMPGVVVTDEVVPA